MTTTEPDSGIRITLTPSQSSYFAGEPCTFTITFTNTHPPAPPPIANATASHHQSSGSFSSATGPAGFAFGFGSNSKKAHKRAVHSISSAPLSRPPTSPGISTPSRQNSPVSMVDGVGKRKGLIGAGIGHSSNDPVASAPIRQPVSAGYLESDVLLHHPYSHISSPGISSPLSRTPTLDLQRGHPHARKVSLMDGSSSPTSSEPHSSQASFSTKVSPLAAASPVSDSPVSGTFPPPSASTSSFSVTLDPISEGGGAASTPTPTDSHSASHDPPPQPLPTLPTSKLASRKPPLQPLGLGIPRAVPPSASAFPQPPASSTLPAPTNTELILYAYAQLSGFCTLTPPQSYKHTEPVRYLRRALLDSTRRGAVLGGGSMDISSSTSSSSSTSAPSAGRRRRPVRHGRSSSFSGAILGLVEAATGLEVAPSPNGALDQDRDVVDESAPLPTLKTQSSVFGVDLVLAPGESRTFTYTFVLPANLPPTFKGKYFKFSYELAVGVSRASPFGMRGTAVSRIMKVPVRVYNSVIVDQKPQPYDLTFPISTPFPSSYPPFSPSPSTPTMTFPKSSSQSSIVSLPSTLPSYSSSSPPFGTGIIVDITASQKLLRARGRRSSSIPLPPLLNPLLHGDGVKKGEKAQMVGDKEMLDSLRAYGNELLEASERVGTEGGNVGNTTHTDDDEESGLDGDKEGGCREAVEILTRVVKKVTYDIAHKGKHIAWLTLVKGNYRLGETVQGVLEMNERRGWGRCLMMSTSLESIETLPASLLSPNLPQDHQQPTKPQASSVNPAVISQEQQRTRIRKTHGTNSSRFLSDSLRVPFGLDIPSDGTPSFGVECTFGGNSLSREDGKTGGGVEWNLKLELVVVAAPGVDDEDGPEDGAGGEVKFQTLEREGERGEWGSSWRVASGSWLKVLSPPQRDGDQTVKDGSTGGWGAWLFGGGKTEDEEDGEEDDRKSTLSDYHYQAAVDGEIQIGSYDGIRSSLAGGVGEPINFDGEPVRGLGSHSAENTKRQGKWIPARLETVECHLPVRVWPGNTVFKASDVVWEV